MKDLNIKNTCDHKIGDITFTLDICPKCKGKKTYFDPFIGNTGDFEFVEGSQRLVQDVLKVLLEQLGTNIEDPSWGSDLFTVSTMGDVNLTKARITAAVVNALTHLHDLQDNEGNNYAGVLASEIISRIENLNMISDATEPRRVELLLNIIAKSFDYTKVSVPIGNQI